MTKKSTKNRISEVAHQANKIKETPLKTREKFSIKLKLAVFLGLISFVVYANTLKNGFAVDDMSVITENTIVNKGISAIPEILSTPYRHGFFITSNDLYRPLSLVMFAVEYQFFGGTPLPYHLMNVLIFSFCVIFLFNFLALLFEKENKTVAFVAALLFALHPIHTEVVANIKSRDELLCFFFAFLSLNVFIRYADQHKLTQLLAGAFFFFLSLLSKESVITFLAIIPVIFFFIKNNNRKQSLNIVMASTFAALIYLTIRFEILSYYHANNVSDLNFLDNELSSKSLTIESRVATAVLILGYYIRLLFIPYPLICDYSYNSIPFVHFNDPLVCVSLVSYIFLGFICIRRISKNHKDPYAFGILFFLVTISLVSNIIFLIGTTMGERMLFFPSVGFCFIAALIICKLIKNTTGENFSTLRDPRILGIIIPVCIVYAAISFDRNSDWKDNNTLYQTDIKKAPNNCRIYYNLYSELEKKYQNSDINDSTARKKIIMEEITYLNKALAIYPDYWRGQIELAFAYFYNFQYDSAEVHAQKAIDLNPDSTIVFYDIATIYYSQKKYSQAIELYKKVIKMDPNYEVAQFGLGICYFYTGQYDSADVHLQIGILQNHITVDQIRGFAHDCFIGKRYAEAIVYYKKAIDLQPNNVYSYTDIAACYLNTNKVDSGLYYLYKAVSIDPMNNTPYEYISKVYLSINKLDSAKKYEAIAQKNNPKFKL